MDTSKITSAVSKNFENVVSQYRFQRKRPLKIEYEELSSSKLSDDSVDKKEKLESNCKSNVHLKTDCYNEEDDSKLSEESVDEKEKLESNCKSNVHLKTDCHNEEDASAVWTPVNWKMQLQNIKQMRKDRTAVVDTLGCERLADPNASPEVRRFQHFTSLLLSSMTNDKVTSAAVERLKERGLSPAVVNEMTLEEIGQLIKPVGFWPKKAKYLKEGARICLQEHNGDIPDTAEGLMSLPGFGPKMAHICMNVAWGILSGIGVDTHVHRIVARLGWTPKKCKGPEDTRKMLEEWLPREEWKDINWLLVGFGQERCKSKNPLCETCLNKEICPEAKRQLKDKRLKDKVNSKKSKSRKC